MRLKVLQDCKQEKSFIRL